MSVEIEDVRYYSKWRDEIYRRLKRAISDLERQGFKTEQGEKYGNTEERKYWEIFRVEERVERVLKGIFRRRWVSVRRRKLIKVGCLETDFRYNDKDIFLMCFSPEFVDVAFRFLTEIQQKWLRGCRIQFRYRIIRSYPKALFDEAAEEPEPMEIEVEDQDGTRVVMRAEIIKQQKRGKEAK